MATEQRWGDLEGRWQQRSSRARAEAMIPYRSDYLAGPGTVRYAAVVLLAASALGAAPIVAQLVALAAALTSVYFGAAWVTDALVAYLLGNLAAMLAWSAVSQFVPAGDAAGLAEADILAQGKTQPRGAPRRERLGVGRKR